ncbi:MAG: amidohydrolase family protein [Proteobacteria bacterium]|nr:amidohydrolase family protein [Pseudomonadota bacterium]
MLDPMPIKELAVVVDEWFDGETRHRDPATFLVQLGRITHIVAGDFGSHFAARGVPVERGVFLMPGLVDAHVHLFLDGAPTDGPTRSAHLKKSVDELTEAARASARQSLACGVTLVRDAGDRHGINNRVRDEVRNGPTGLARVRSGGLGVKRPKRYGGFMAGDVEDDDAIRASVAELAKANDEIKLILTGIIDFDAGAVTDEPQFDLESARLVVNTAKAHGRKTFAHCSGEKGLAIAARAGVGSIEHGFFMNRETLALMRDNAVAWTPTFCPVHFQWAEPQAVGWSQNTVGNLRRILDAHAEHLRLADEMGVTLLMGTDAGSMGVEHGHALFEEIDRYLEAGLSLEKTLAAATAAARRHFGFAHTRLERGAPFEAVLLDASPFDDLRACRQPRRVWLG